MDDRPARDSNDNRDTDGVGDAVTGAVLTQDSIVTLSVTSAAAVRQRAVAALSGQPQGAHISFPTIDMLWRVLSPRRWDLLRAMVGQGPLPIREVARRVGRDVKAVHGDIHALLDAGLLVRDGRGVAFPYAGVKVDFTLDAAA